MAFAYNTDTKEIIRNKRKLEKKLKLMGFEWGEDTALPEPWVMVREMPEPETGEFEKAVRRKKPRQGPGGRWIWDWRIVAMERAEAIAEVRLWRDNDLAESDLLLLRELEKLLPVNNPVRKYRKALRDVPKQDGFPFEVVRPTKP